MNVKEAISELKQCKDLVFLLAAHGENGRVCGYAPDFATALNTAISAYHGSQLECPYGEPLDEDLIRTVQSVVNTLKQSSIPFVLAWHVPCDAVARLDCGGDINLRQELIDCLTDELQDVFTF